MASDDSALTGSAIAIRPATRPSMATHADVRPLPAAVSAACLQRSHLDSPCAEETGTADENSATVDHSLDTLAGQRHEVLELPESELVLASAGHDRARQGMLTALLRGRRRVQDASGRRIPAPP